MFEFNVGEDIKKKDIIRELVVGKIAHLHLTLITKKLKFSVEHGKMITTLNIIKH